MPRRMYSLSLLLYVSNKTNDKKTGCWFWLDDLYDIEEGADGDQMLFFRVDSPLDNDLGSSSLPSVGNQLRSSGSLTTLRGVIISISVIFALALLCSTTYISYKRTKRKDRNIKEHHTLQLYGSEDLMDQDNQSGEDDKKDIDVPFFEFETILDATDNFSKAYKLGQGGFGPVYKGKFPGGEEIAVKRLSSNSGQDLLYEYMPNKSLDAFIFDLKPNIEMNPKISDFGLARIVGRRDKESNTTRVMGTYGYMAPEYALEGQFSVKSDAFSFGVVVLEIISGKKNTSFVDSQLAQSLLGMELVERRETIDFTG
ncbi:hypothetical protein POM88_042654 [Heracleum sosnowskyi]|uniref:Protein kinase domain-containing protein n=1 Tax=Heracleum sosnowskyi TaxID=360622 RepID=A0AAD8HIT0_9APIA|nr:hypothetical protein POM88_042654 [Heracleum sosnowskyi]